MMQNLEDMVLLGISVWESISLRSRNGGLRQNEDGTKSVEFGSRMTLLSMSRMD
jgi:hypothetical protein